MAPLPTEITGTHPHITTPSPLFEGVNLQEPFTAAKVTAENSAVNALEVNTNDNLVNMDLCHFTHNTSTTSAPTLSEEEFKK